MRMINLATDAIKYPVGDYIVYNLPKIDEMYKVIIKLPEIKKFLSDKSKIYFRISLICSGSSGAIIASIIASKLINDKIDVNILHVKKEGEDSHSGNKIKFFNNSFNIVVDDFICSGSTIRRIFNKVDEICDKNKIHCVCITDTVSPIMVEYFQENKLKYLICKVPKKRDKYLDNPIF